MSNFQKEFIDTFKSLTHMHNSWQIWEDFVVMTACAISNRVDLANFDKREQQYMDRIGRYDKQDGSAFPRLIAITVGALDQDPEQDFLGDLFQQLELSNHWRGQFFTPYQLCKVIAEIQVAELPELVKEKGYVTISDPACGAGATLIAFANVAKSRGVNYQQHVLFHAQDIDQTAALMCYVQLSLLGCAAYVVVADTLSQPVITKDTDVWYTPMYYSKVWGWRRLYHKIGGCSA